MLSCVTLGINTPWAIVKCRRYKYENLTLNGQPFTTFPVSGDNFIEFLMGYKTTKITKYYIQTHPVN
ncbi:DUF898 family protein [Citrobacter werkmanii]|uniref:DUF898 family protein n=1 Tax=Citrobacter werkmanii TaxID=67827 RepID=UPI003463E8B4